MENKTVALQSSEYVLLCQSFKEWLQLLNYSEHSIPFFMLPCKGFFNLPGTKQQIHSAAINSNRCH